MHTITYAQIQELLMRLPITKLPLAYRLLTDLAESEAEVSSPQQDFMLLSPDERRSLLAQQAEQMATHYEQTTADREAWQGGDIIDED